MKIVLILISIYAVTCRDYYVGMFKKNDLLVAQDTLYKEKVPFRKMYAKYGRIFKCPITYIRVVDRLGVGRGPTVEVIRGGLRKKHVVLRITSVYNQPVSVNIYVGCENKIHKRKTTKSKKTKSAKPKLTTTKPTTTKSKTTNSTTTEPGTTGPTTIEPTTIHSDTNKPTLTTPDSTITDSTESKPIETTPASTAIVTSEGTEHPTT